MHKILSSIFVSVLILFSINIQAETNADLQRLQRAEADASQELLQIENDILQDRARLQADELEISSPAITPAILEDARMELVSLASRESGLNTRLKARSNNLQQLSADIVKLENRNLRNNVDAAKAEQWNSELQVMRQRRDLLDGLIVKLERLHQRYQTRAALARQRLNLLQSRFELPDLDTSRQPSGRAGRELQLNIDKLLAEASSARREAATLGKKSLADKARGRLLDLSALVAEEQAELFQLEISRLQMGRVLQSLSVFSGSTSTPVRVLETALHNISKMQAEVERQQELVKQKHNQFTAQRLLINQKGAIATGADSTFNARLALIDKFIGNADKSLIAITELGERIKTSHEAYTTAVVTNAGTELLIRRELPSDVESWQQLAGNLAAMPARVLLALKQSVLNASYAFMQAESATRALCLLLVFILLAGGWLGRRRLSRKLEAVKQSADADETAAWLPLAIVQRNMFSLLPPLFIFGIGIILKLRQVDLILLLAPVLIWPVVRFSLDFINNLLAVYTPELDLGKTRILLLETRWVVITAAILTAVLVAAHSVALSPAVIDAIDRLSMLCLLLISIPLLHLRMLLLEGIRGDVVSRLVRGFTLAIPLILILCAFIGVIGYINLALAIAVRLGWLMLVGLAVHLVRNVIRVLYKFVQHWFERRDAESAPYWDQYILGPVYRIVLLLLVLAAAQLLFYLYEWNAQTPFVSAVPLLLDSTLFSIGESSIKLKTLLLASLVVFVAIWGASWSKQVSHRWLYTGVVDQGIRNSLSTFTQYIVVVLGLVVAMKIIGLDLTALTVFAGALGVGIGFGMQQIVVNFISGILLLVERPLATTDIVNVDKYEGEVTRIGIRSLTVKTFDNQEVIIPNSSVITKPFTNWTRSDDIMRTILMVGISYDDDPHQAVQIIKDIVGQHSAVLDDPGYKVLLWDYGESALMLRVQFHTRIRGAIGRADVRSQLLFSIWDAFKEAGITIPYPQRDLHLHGNSGDSILN